MNGEIPCSYPATVKVKEGSSVKLEAMPAPGYRFIGWQGEDSIDGLENPVVIKAVRTINVTALFAPEESEFTADNGPLHITVPYGTESLDTDGAPISQIKSTVLDDPPAPDRAKIIGSAYLLQPDGTTFSPPVIMTWSYDPQDIPRGTMEQELQIAYYDDGASHWVALNSTVDTIAHTVSTSVGHLSIYALLAPLTPPPPEVIFVTSSLQVQPEEVAPGELVTINVRVRNISKAAGSCTVELEIDGAVADYQETTLNAGAYTTLTFEATRSQPGTYIVAVNGLDEEGKFTVEGALPAPPDTAKPLLYAPKAASTASSGVSVSTVVLILLFVAPASLAIFLATHRRRRSSPAAPVPVVPTPQPLPPPQTRVVMREDAQSQPPRTSRERLLQEFSELIDKYEREIRLSKETPKPGKLSGQNQCGKGTDTT